MIYVVVDVIRQYVQVVAKLGMTIERTRLLAQKSLMLAPATGADEFESFLYVLQADRHWRLAVAIRVEEGRVSIVAPRVTGFQPGKLACPGKERRRAEELTLDTVCENAANSDPIRVLCMPLINRVIRLAAMGSRFARKMTQPKFHVSNEINALGEFSGGS